MSTDSTAAPFTATRETFGGRTETYFDVAAFVEALAAELGLVPMIEERGEWAVAKIDAGGGLTLYVHAQHGANARRVRLSSGMQAEWKLNHHARQDWPSITVSADRPLQRIAADVRRRLLEPSAPLVDASKARIAEEADRVQSLRTLAEQLPRECPGLQVKIEGDNPRSAGLYLNRGKTYVLGQLSPNGEVHFERVAVRSVDGARRLLEFLAAEAARG